MFDRFDLESRPYSNRSFWQCYLHEGQVQSKVLDCNAHTRESKQRHCRYLDPWHREKVWQVWYHYLLGSWPRVQTTWEYQWAFKFGLAFWGNISKSRPISGQGPWGTNMYHLSQAASVPETSDYRQKDMPTQPLDTWSPRRAESIQAVGNCNSSDWGFKARFPFTCNHNIAICCMQKLVSLSTGETPMAGNDTISNGMLLLLKQTSWNAIRTKQKNTASTGPTKRAQEEAWCRGWKAERRRQPATKRQVLHGERRNRERQTRRNQLQEIWHMKRMIPRNTRKNNERTGAIACKEARGANYQWTRRSDAERARWPASVQHFGKAKVRAGPETMTLQSQPLSNIRRKAATLTGSASYILVECFLNVTIHEKR